MYDNSLWQPVRKDIAHSEKLERKSLTYAQDSWRRMKANKLALLCMLLILFVLVAAVVIPYFYPISYSYQRLEFANIPPKLKVYPISDDKAVYITQEYKAIVTTMDGELIKQSDLIREDMNARMRLYDVDGKELLIDYSSYFLARKELQRLERLEKKNQPIRIEDAEFLRAYYGPDVSDKAVVSYADAKTIVEEHVPRVNITYDGQELQNPIRVRNKTFIWGSDVLGRDMFIRVVYGARVSLIVGFAAALINFIIGVFYGGISGYFGGRIDNIMMRFVDILSSIPMMLYVILIIVIMKPGLKSIIFAMSITYWVDMARIVRAQVLSLREQEFIQAIRLLGGNVSRILTRHLIPNAMGPIMVSLSMQIPSAMFTEAFLSFTGLGVTAPRASWGSLCNDALQGLSSYPYQMFYPAIAMSITILAFNLFSDGLRDALDPKLRK